MMEPVVAIIKTAKDNPLWKGLPDDYPVQCMEFLNRADAEAAYPSARIMGIKEYHAFAKSFHEQHPAPDYWRKNGRDKPWWRFW